MYLKQLICKDLKGFDQINIDLCPLASAFPSKRTGVGPEMEALEQLDGLLQSFDGTPRALTHRADPSEAFASQGHDEYYPGWSVITGDNGSGKTTLLKAIALAMMGPAKARYLQTSYEGWVTHGRTRAEISLEIRPESGIDKATGRPYVNTFWAEVDIDRPDENAGPEIWELKQGNHYRKKQKGAFNGPWSTQAGWLAVGYGPFRRLYGSSSTAAELAADPIKARFATLFLEDATLIGAERWLHELDYGARDNQPGAKDILESVKTLLQADFLRNDMNFERVDSTGVWLKDAHGRPLRLADMSEGYRAALAMLIDIVRHMFLAYGPAAEIIKHGHDGAYVDAPAVVLIDEVDAHLHPAWQREIGTWLCAHFPRVQFIVTTHSPLVCQAASGGRIYVLPPPASGLPVRRLSAQEFTRIVAGDTDDILQTSAFGLSETRSTRMAKARRRYADLRQLSLFQDAEDEQEFRQLELLVKGELPEK